MVLGNAYLLPVPVAALGILGFKTSCYGATTWAYFPNCDVIQPTAYGVIGLVVPALLVMLGALIIIFKKKFLAQISAVVILAQIFLLFTSYFSIFIQPRLLPQGTWSLGILCAGAVLPADSDSAYFGLNLLLDFERTVDDFEGATASFLAINFS